MDSLTLSAILSIIINMIKGAAIGLSLIFLFKAMRIKMDNDRLIKSYAEVARNTKSIGFIYYCKYKELQYKVIDIEDTDREFILYEGSSPIVLNNSVCECFETEEQMFAYKNSHTTTNINSYLYAKDTKNMFIYLANNINKRKSRYIRLSDDMFLRDNMSCIEYEYYLDSPSCVKYYVEAVCSYKNMDEFFKLSKFIFGNNIRFSRHAAYIEDIDTMYKLTDDDIEILSNPYLDDREKVAQTALYEKVLDRNKYKIRKHFISEYIIGDRSALEYFKPVFRSIEEQVAIAPKISKSDLEIMKEQQCTIVHVPNIESVRYLKFEKEIYIHTDDTGYLYEYDSTWGQFNVVKVIERGIDRCNHKYIVACPDDPCILLCMSCGRLFPFGAVTEGV